MYLSVCVGDGQIRADVAGATTYTKVGDEWQDVVSEGEVWVNIQWAGCNISLRMTLDQMDQLRSSLCHSQRAVQEQHDDMVSQLDSDILDTIRVRLS